MFLQKGKKKKQQPSSGRENKRISADISSSLTAKSRTCGLLPTFLRSDVIQRRAAGTSCRSEGSCRAQSSLQKPVPMDRGRATVHGEDKNGKQKGKYQIKLTPPIAALSEEHGKREQRLQATTVNSLHLQLLSRCPPAPEPPGDQTPACHSFWKNHPAPGGVLPFPPGSLSFRGFTPAGSGTSRPTAASQPPWRSAAAAGG